MYLLFQDHLGWKKVHLVGHSMGAMIAAKFTVLAPHRVESLLLISPTGGGFESLPRSIACLKICTQVSNAACLHLYMCMLPAFHCADLSGKGMTLIIEGLSV